MDKVLSKKERQAVASLSSRANPTAREVSFIYHADGYDIPGGWEALMEKYYDVMYSESYDWWTLAIAFNSSKGQVAELKKYEFDGEDDCGINVHEQGGRTFVEINCRLDSYYIDDPYDKYDDDDDFEEDEGDTESLFVAENELLNLLVKIREQLIQGDYRALYAVWQKYGYLTDEDEENDDDDEKDEYESIIPPKPPERSQGKSIIEQFSNMLE